MFEREDENHSCSLAEFDRSLTSAKASRSLMYCHCTSGIGFTVRHPWKLKKSYEKYTIASLSLVLNVPTETPGFKLHEFNSPDYYFSIFFFIRSDRRDFLIF